MKESEITTIELILPFFQEKGKPKTTEEFHPVYTPEMFSAEQEKNIPVDPKKASDMFDIQILTILFGLNIYDFYLFLSHLLENVYDKKKWLDTFILLISSNKNVILLHQSVDNYFYLFSLATKMLHEFSNISPVHLFRCCEEHHHNSFTNANNRLDSSIFLKPLERQYSVDLLCLEAMQLIKIGFLLPGNLFQARLNFEKAVADLDVKMLKELIIEHEVKLLNTEFTFKKIHVNCSAVTFGKIYGLYIKEAKDENGEYVYDYQTTSLAISIVSSFHFDIGNQVSARTMRDYLPLKRKVTKKRHNQGRKH